MRTVLALALLLAACVGSQPLSAIAAEGVLSHPPLRTPRTAASRPLNQGPAYFVDAHKGNDNAAGTKEQPWKTLAHALKQLRAGDTLYLRGGTYYENVYCALAGTGDRPITLRSYPGEEVILDGGVRAFFEHPAESWEPVENGAPGEYRSVQDASNLRNIYGWFGDSMIGLNTYFHAKDLRATNELLDWENWDDPKQSDLKPLYCGPGLWYNEETGRIHVRLAHTHLDGGINYTGETDPRKLPLVITPFRSVTLHLDGARHLRLQDVVLRGGGYETIVIDQAQDIAFENVTVWSGSYGARITGTRKLRIEHCGFYGSCPPWIFRADSSLRSYPGRPHRDITRLNTHALLVPEAGREFSVYAYPVNDDWEIAFSEFTDAHDGVYLGGVSSRFHHNLIDGLQDDGLYLSPMSPRYHPEPAEIHISQNLFKSCLTALAFGGSEPKTTDWIFITRNILDLRGPVYTQRPSVRNTRVIPTTGNTMGDHGSPPWPAMNIYHNTCILAQNARTADMQFLGATSSERPRRVLNNIFLHLGRLPAVRALEPEHGLADGLLYWFPGVDEATVKNYFAKYRNSPAFQASQQVYSPGFLANSLLADPQFVRFSTEAHSMNDYRVRPESPTVNAGVPIPDEWPDPLRSFDQGTPDIGALLLGAEPLRVGRHADRQQ